MSHVNCIFWYLYYYDDYDVEAMAAKSDGDGNDCITVKPVSSGHRSSHLKRAVILDRGDIFFCTVIFIRDNSVTKKMCKYAFSHLALNTGFNVFFLLDTQMLGGLTKKRGETTVTWGHIDSLNRTQDISLFFVRRKIDIDKS